MNKLKFIFPLSFLFKTQKKFFIAIISYLVIYLAGGFINTGYIGNVISVYVYIGAAILMINYLTKNKEDKDETP